MAEHYQYHGESLPISSFISDPHTLAFADKLHHQAMQMERAQANERYFNYHAIPVPKNLIHVFGK